MSIQLIRQYHTKVAKIIQYSGSHNESALRKPFQDLLEQYARARSLELIAELDYRTPAGATVYPDGTLKDALRQDWGYWESKDQFDDLDAEIKAKLAKGYPKSNILFEDTRTAVLYQAGQEVARADFKDDQALDTVLARFVSYESREVREFREAIEQFSQEVPALAEDLRAIIAEQAAANPAFQQSAQAFLQLCREAINPAVDMADAREMIIQHVLTQDIFTKIFDDPQFHLENNIAQRLGQVVNTFYHGATRHQISDRLGHYYATINARAAQIYNHQEKQKFLKALYESFYRAYNPKAADRLGIVYTPNEIVRFMIEAADTLAFKHFGKTLGDKGVDLLDPATGTGTFITELIDYLPPHQLEYKYRHEIHCNEVAILPYYIANLNIEFTYRQKMGKYVEFQNIVFVDTLDNLGFKYANKQLDFFHLAGENVARIQRQNERDISVIIGNPPYNAWQDNFNLQNPNRPYKEIDRRIKDTYIKHGTAQNQIAVYDMYTRFFRWATDRIGQDGIIAFITNNSFIDARTYDGFRKCIEDEFDYAYIIDLGGNIRKLSGKDGIFLNEEHTIFGVAAAVGIAITFLVKRKSSQKLPCQIRYIHPTDIRATRYEKLEYLQTHPFSEIPFEHIQPDPKHYWINLTDNDWDNLLPLMDKDVKTGAGTGQDAVFKLFSRGVATQRDEWVYDYAEDTLADKMRFFVDIYQKTVANPAHPDKFQIKWDRELTKYQERGINKTFEEARIVTSQYRPFVKMHLYFDPHFNGMTYQLPLFFPHREAENLLICFTDSGSEKPFMVMASNHLTDLHLVGAGSSTQCLPLYRYPGQGQREDNITDWALAQFRARYQPSPLTPLPKGEGDSSSPIPLGEKSRIKGSFPPLPGGEGPGVRETASSTTAPASTPTPDPKLKPPLPPALKARARELRRSATDAEKLLWGLLRDRQLAGAKFRRQHPIGSFILDFYCHEAKLALELDGSQHAQPEQAEYDSARTQALAAEGIQVLRFWNNEVLQQTESVLEAIWEVVANQAVSPSPLTPLPEGEGNSSSPLPLGEGPGVRETNPLPLGETPPMPEITKPDIFHYVYAVLHHPAYRQKYELNLKREFPRIPFYADFWQWAEWGRRLLDLHLHYETVPPYPLERLELDPATVRQPYKAKLKAVKSDNLIELDTLTTLAGIPPAAWEYRLGNRSALEWVLDRYKETTPGDPTIRARFNTYRFPDYKEAVIDLLQRVCTVSVETMQIIGEMKES